MEIFKMVSSDELTNLIVDFVKSVQKVSSQLDILFHISRESFEIVRVCLDKLFIRFAACAHNYNRINQLYENKIQLNFVPFQHCSLVYNCFLWTQHVRKRTNDLKHHLSLWYDENFKNREIKAIFQSNMQKLVMWEDVFEFLSKAIEDSFMADCVVSL